MNLGNLLKGALSALTGGVSNLFEGDNLGNALNNAGNTWADIGNQNMLGNLVAKYTGSRLTNAEQQANAFNAIEAQKNRDFQQSMFDQQTELANTAYQRQVADMQAAGINPMMAASGSGGAAVSSAGSGAIASSVAPSGAALNLGSLLSLMFQSKLAFADIALKNAEKEKIQAETEGVNLNNEILSLTKDAKVQSENLRAELNRKNSAMIDKQLDEIDAHILSLRESAKTEESKRDLNMASSILAKMNSYTAVALLPYEQAYKAAATDNQRQAAILAAAHSLYQNRLIDEGYIDAIVSKAKYEASSAESRSELDAIKAAIRTGDYSNVKHVHGLASDALSVVSILLDNFNPLNGLIGGK